MTTGRGPQALSYARQRQQQQQQQPTLLPVPLGVLARRRRRRRRPPSSSSSSGLRFMTTANRELKAIKKIAVVGTIEKLTWKLVRP